MAEYKINFTLCKNYVQQKGHTTYFGSYSL